LRARGGILNPLPLEPLPDCADATGAAAQLAERRAGELDTVRKVGVRQLVETAAVPSAQRPCEKFNLEQYDIRERLAKADPGNAGWQLDLALSYGRVAFVENASRRP